MAQLLAGLPTALAALLACAALAAAELSCDNVRCGWGATCVLEEGRPECRCNDICLDLYRPVCGSDGKTYANRCYLERAACQQKASIGVAGEGRCPAASTTRRPCNSVCPAIYKPVCGSDHKQYSNECAMKVAACKSGRSISKANEGGCESLAPTRPSCQAQLVCTADYQPVCSSDNVTYQNQCELENAACRSAGGIRKQYDGVCETFAPTPGPRGCRRCPRGPLLPVCGSNGATYSNQCELERAACLEQRRITRAHQGRCAGEGARTTRAGPECGPCPAAGGRQVCGSDNKTYPSLCELKRAACLEQSEISLKFERPCGKIKLCPATAEPTT